MSKKPPAAQSFDVDPIAAMKFFDALSRAYDNMAYAQAPGILLVDVPGMPGAQVMVALIHASEPATVNHALRGALAPVLDSLRRAPAKTKKASKAKRAKPAPAAKA